MGRYCGNFKRKSMIVCRSGIEFGCETDIHCKNEKKRFCQISFVCVKKKIMLLKISFDNMFKIASPKFYKEKKKAVNILRGTLF